VFCAWFISRWSSFTVTPFLQPHRLLATVNILFGLSFIAGLITGLWFRISVFVRAQCADGSVLLILTRVMQ
jgi:hypothetical protein